MLTQKHTALCHGSSFSQTTVAAVNTALWDGTDDELDYRKIS